MSRLRNLAKGLILVALVTGLYNFVDRVVLTNPVAQSDTRTKNYVKAQRRIQQALVTQASELDLSGLYLTQLPSELHKLSKLKELNLDRNRLNTLPPEIAQLTVVHQQSVGLLNL